MALSITNNLAQTIYPKVVSGSLQGRLTSSISANNINPVVSKVVDLQSVSRSSEKTNIFDDSSSNTQPSKVSFSSKSIDPILIDKVFRLNTKGNEPDVNLNRPVDLYRQTEKIASAGIASTLTVGLDLYV